MVDFVFLLVLEIYSKYISKSLLTNWIYFANTGIYFWQKFPN